MSSELRRAIDLLDKDSDRAVALAEYEALVAAARKSREMPCFCGTPDAYRCPAHINPVQFTSGGR